MGLFDFFKRNKREEVLSLEQLIEKLRDEGLTDEEIEEKLIKDLHEGGEIFGDFRKAFKSTGGEEKLDRSDKQLYKWGGMGDNRMCDICRRNHNSGPKTYNEWKKIGLPGSTPCQEDCRCSLYMYDPDMEKIDSLMPMKEMAFEALSTSRENPRKAIDSLESLCKKLLETGKEIKSKEDLQIYYGLINFLSHM